MQVPHFGRLKFLLPGGGQSLARIFRLMEAHKQELGVLAYGVQMPSLEQVLLPLAHWLLHARQADGPWLHLHGRCMFGSYHAAPVHSWLSYP